MISSNIRDPNFPFNQIYSERIYTLSTAALSYASDYASRRIQRNIPDTLRVLNASLSNWE